MNSRGALFITPPRSNYLALNAFFFKLARVKSFILRFVSAAFISLQFSIQAQDPSVPTKSQETIKLTLGKITVDKEARTIQFPATVNLGEGTLEYLLVSDQGKTHESLFATKVSPFQLQVAMLLLGVQPPQEIKEIPPEQITRDSLKTTPEVKGDNIDILITLPPSTQPIHAEEWIHNQLTQSTMATGPWIFTGSAIFQKRFLAQEEGSIVALVTDSVALINNPRPGHNDDTIWSVQKDKVPAVGTPVIITFQLLTPTHP